jgi:hypothetical protein
MVAESIKLAKIAQQNLVIQEVSSFVRNPIIIAVTAAVIIEALQKKGWMGENIGTMIEVGALATPVMSEAYKSGAIESLSKVPGDVLKGVGSVVPLLTSGG